MLLDLSRDRREAGPAARQAALEWALGIPAKHISLTSSLWTKSVWRDDEILFTNGPGLQGQIDRAFAEIMENDRNTAPYPVSMSVKFGSCPRPISWQETRNIITTSGLEEMAERSTGESSTANTHHAIGTGTVAEALADTALGTEVARKELGSAARNGTTEKYSTAFGSGDISVTLPVDITEAGIFTSSSGGVCVVRETSDGQAIASGNTLVATVDIAHVNGTEA